MTSIGQAVKLCELQTDLLHSVGYDDSTRTLYVKQPDGRTMRLENVPRFRWQGLMAAPRKDAYYRAFIKDQFLTKPV
jgi:hypothetical protein